HRGGRHHAAGLRDGTRATRPGPLRASRVRPPAGRPGTGWPGPVGPGTVAGGVAQGKSCSAAAPGRPEMRPAPAPGPEGTGPPKGPALPAWSAGRAGAGSAAGTTVAARAPGGTGGTGGPIGPANGTVGAGEPTGPRSAGNCRPSGRSVADAWAARLPGCVIVIVSGKNTIVFLGFSAADESSGGYETVSRAAKLVRSTTRQPASSTPEVAGSRRAVSAGGWPRKIRSACSTTCSRQVSSPAPSTWAAVARPAPCGSWPSAGPVTTVAPTVPRQNSRCCPPGPATSRVKPGAAPMPSLSRLTSSSPAATP